MPYAVRMLKGVWQLATNERLAGQRSLATVVGYGAGVRGVVGVVCTFVTAGDGAVIVLPDVEVQAVLSIQRKQSASKRRSILYIGLHNSLFSPEITRLQAQNLGL